MLNIICSDLMSSLLSSCINIMVMIVRDIHDENTSSFQIQFSPIMIYANIYSVKIKILNLIFNSNRYRVSEALTLGHLANNYAKPLPGQNSKRKILKCQLSKSLIMVRKFVFLNSFFPTVLLKLSISRQV